MTSESFFAMSQFPKEKLLGLVPRRYLLICPPPASARPLRCRTQQNVSKVSDRLIQTIFCHNRHNYMTSRKRLGIYITLYCSEFKCDVTRYNIAFCKVLQNSVSDSMANYEIASYHLEQNGQIIFLRIINLMT